MKRFAFFVLLTGCGGGAVAKAPPPFRPKAVEQPAPPPTAGDTSPTDCQPMSTKDQLPALTYGERSIPEADRLAVDGLKELQAAETPGVEKVERERLITGAVATLVQALLADPYNVDATYNLAAAYARIGRSQCSINLLERLFQMRTHESKRTAVEGKLDRLLGRNRKQLDPDFDDMRGDPRFRTLIKEMCAGTDDPGCVYGK